MDRSRTRHAAARLAALLCALLAVAGAAPGSGAAAAGGTGVTAADVDSAVSFRQTLGFRAGRAYVAATFGNPTFGDMTWGVPLDPAEAAETDRRAKLQKDLGPALRAWARKAASAGAYIDHEASGAPVFLTTGDPERGRAAVTGLLPRGANARFVTVRHSMATLLSVQDRINADLRAGELASLGVTSTSIDARTNAVIVGVAGDAALVRAAIRERYGDAAEVAFEPAAQGGDAGGCVARDDCPPAKAGIEIRSSYNGNNCTTGFLARVVGSAQPRILTAGHCIAKSGGTGMSRKWKNDGVDMGWAELSSWTDGADADVGVLAPPASSVSGDRNLLFRASSSDIVPITAWRASAEQIQGELLCRAGATSGYKCGTIIATNRTKDVDGHTIDHQWVVDFDGCPGDSGAPYFAGGVAFGLHTDSTVGCEPATNQAWYSPIGWALDVLASRGHPVELCVTAGCGSETNLWTTRQAIATSSWKPNLVNLEDGQVLAVGGTHGDLLVADAGANGLAPELFDPPTGSWSDAATPPWAPAACEGQFAVRLDDGTVLVGGGRDDGSGGGEACAGAYSFDPGQGPKGGWSTVASPPVVLEAAAAVLLDDGRAFVAGGSGADGKTPNAIAYSPNEDAWTTLAAPPSGALDPLVLRLPDGRVLVSGGYAIADAATPGYVSRSGTAVYDPATDAWMSTSGVGARGLAGTVLGDGRAVIAGGQQLTWDGAQHATFLATVRAFDPATNTWTTSPSLRRPRAAAVLAELPNGLLLAAAGRLEGTTPAGAATRTTEAFDAATGAWYTAPSLAVTHGNPAGAILADGRVLVAGGGNAATETYVAGDVLPPAAAAPGFALRSGATMTSSAIPIRVSWTGTDRGGSGVGTYDIARSVDGAAFTTIASHVPAAFYDTTGSNGHTYRFQVRPRDWAGNLGAWVPGTSRKLGLLEQTSPKITYAGTWSTNLSSSYSAGSVRYASTSGRSASYTFTGRGIAWVSAKGPSRGSARVYIDGTLAGTVSLYSASRTYRYVAFARSWGTSAQHTIKIVVVGTSGHPRVDLDVFEVLTGP